MPTVKVYISGVIDESQKKGKHVSDKPRMPSQHNPAGRNLSGETRSNMPSWYAAQEEAAQLQRAVNTEAHTPTSSKDTDRLWQARFAQSKNRGYYDETRPRSGQVVERPVTDGYRAPREDLERGDWYHQQMTQVRTTMPHAPETSQYRTQVLPNIPGNVPRRAVEAGPDDARMQAKRKRTQARTRGRRKKNLFAQKRRRQKNRTVIFVCIIVMLIIFFVLILALTGGQGSASST